jgi:hypothetical protein
MDDGTLDDTPIILIVTVSEWNLAVRATVLVWEE